MENELILFETADKEIKLTVPAYHLSPGKSSLYKEGTPYRRNLRKPSPAC